MLPVDIGTMSYKDSGLISFADWIFPICSSFSCVVTPHFLKNVLEKNIYYELFKSSQENKVTIPKSGDVEITFIVDDYSTKIKSTKQKTVLDSALDNDIDAPYSCNGGVCGSCIGKIIKGEVKMMKNTVLTDSELSDGLILACQAIPLSDIIEVDFDDV